MLPPLLLIDPLLRLLEPELLIDPLLLLLRERLLKLPERHLLLTFGELERIFPELRPLLILRLLRVRELVILPLDRELILLEFLRALA